MNRCLVCEYSAGSILGVILEIHGREEFEETTPRLMMQVSAAGRQAGSTLAVMPWWQADR